MDKRIWICTAVAMAVLLTGCGGGHPKAGATSGKSATGRSSAATAPAVPVADPPVRFDTRRAVELPAEARQSGYTTSYGALPVLLDDRTAVSVADGVMYGVDILTGRQVWKTGPRKKLFSRSSDTRATVVMLQGRRTALAAFMTEVPGQGTTPSGAAIELIGVDLASGKNVLNDDLPLPQDSAPWGNPVSVVGVDATTAVLNWSGGGTVVADLAAHKVRWIRRGFDAIGLDGGVIAGQTGDLLHYRLLGLRATDQRQEWASKEYEVPTFEAEPAGPGLYSLHHSTGSVRDRSSTVLHDIKTGKPRKHLGLEYRWHCVSDGAETLLCNGADGGIVGLDAGTLDTLWRLPSDGRLAPKVTAFWHGAVYGTTPNGPVVLDARSGKDREVRPGAAPRVVSRYGGLVVGPEGAWMVYSTAP
ncbi:PQQ-binding-like beta-propeller repeat protein [Actinomadura sp. NPDC023710]|uniref:outer membrane protein assembly factor BamB family protein n=1 Tax=Actinomadura sp. NPDC023710 TaxID=3158219 RepID=UPI0033FCDFCF